MFRGRIKRLIQKPFIKNVIILSSGTAAAQIIGMLLTPIITRLYGPEAYGLMGTFMAIINIIGPAAALTYPVAIVLPKKDNVAQGIIKLSLILSLLFALIIALLLVLFEDYIVRLFQLDQISSYLYLIPIVIIFAGILQVTQQWLIRKKKFNVSAKTAVIQALIINGGKVGVGLFYPLASVLIVFSAFSQGLRSCLLFYFSKVKIKNLFSIIKVKQPIFKLARKYKDFPLYRAPEVFFSGISGGLPIILLTSFFGPTAAGYYSVGRIVLNIPTQLIGNSVGDVFYPRIAEAANNKENITNLLVKATIILSLVGLVPFGIIILFGPWLFSLIFGQEWLVAGEYARWIAFWSYFSFINRPSIRALPVLSAQRFHLIYTILMLIVRLFLLYIGFSIFNNDIAAVALFGVSGGLLNLGLILITILMSKRFDISNH